MLICKVEFLHTIVCFIQSNSSYLLFFGSLQFSSVQPLSRVWLFAIPWIVARQASLSITNSWSSLRLTAIESVMPSSHLILCRPLLLLPPSFPASESFPMSQLFAWGGQSTGVSALASFLPKNTQDQLPFGLYSYWNWKVSVPPSSLLIAVLIVAEIYKHYFAYLNSSLNLFFKFPRISVKMIKFQCKQSFEFIYQISKDFS